MSGRMLRLMLALGLVAVTACGGATTATTAPSDGDDSSTTSVTDATSTTAETEGSDASGTVGSVSDMPAECMAAFVSFLQEIEPIVQDFDFENTTMNEFEAMSAQIEPISDRFGAATEDCPELDLSAEESLEAMREIAEREAPGTASYFRWLGDFIAASSDGGTASGDCETDIAAFQAFVDAGGTMQDLTMTELATVTSLLTAISTECSAERVGEFFNQPEVAAFIG